MRLYLVRLCACSGLSLALASSARAVPIPVVEYLFNSSSGTNGSVTPVSPGTLAASNSTVPNLTMYSDNAVTPANRIGGVGPSGKAGDTVLLAAGVSSKAITQFVGDIPQLDNAKSFSLTMWVNGANINGTGDDRLLVYGNSDGTASGTIGVEEDTTSQNANVKVGSQAQQTPIGSTPNNAWAFIGITYDGSAGAGASNNLLVYSGSPTSGGITLTNTITLTGGALGAPVIQQLLIGNRSSDYARVSGYAIDDVALWASTTDSSGALSAGNVGTVYADNLANVSVVPEPASAGLLAMTGFLLLRRRRNPVTAI